MSEWRWEGDDGSGVREARGRCVCVCVRVKTCVEHASQLRSKRARAKTNPKNVARSRAVKVQLPKHHNGQPPSPKCSLLTAQAKITLKKRKCRTEENPWLRSGHRGTHEPSRRKPSPYGTRTTVLTLKAAAQRILQHCLTCSEEEHTSERKIKSNPPSAV